MKYIYLQGKQCTRLDKSVSFGNTFNNHDHNDYDNVLEPEIQTGASEIVHIQFLRSVTYLMTNSKELGRSNISSKLCLVT